MNVKKARAMIAIGADAKGLDKGLNDAKKRLKGFSKSTSKILGKGAGVAKGGLGMLGTGLGIQAAGGLMAMGADIMNVEKQLARFQIAGEVSSATMSDFRDELKNVSNATGVSRNELVKGAQAYVALTGDAAGAIEATRLFGEVAAGTGASMEDVSATAAALRQNLKIDPKDFRKAFDVLVKQGKIGAIEIKDLATKMANIAPQFSSFAGSRNVEGMSELGAMLQVAKQGFGSADEAATGFNGMMTQLNRNQKKLKKLGIKVVDPKTGKFKNLLQIVREIGENKAIQKPGAMLEALGEEKAVRAMSVLIENLKEVDRIKRESLNSDQVAKDNLAFQASTAGKLQRAMETAKNVIAEAFTPDRIERFAAAVVKLGDAFAKIVGFISDIAGHIDEMNLGSDAGKKMTADFASQGLTHDDSGKALSPEESKKRILAAARGEKVDAFNMNAAQSKEERVAAARAAAKRTGMLIPQDDNWAQGRAAGNPFAPQQQQPLDFKVLGDAVAAALARNPLVVRLGSSTVTKEIDKSPAKRRIAKR